MIADGAIKYHSVTIGALSVSDLIDLMICIGMPGKHMLSIFTVVCTVLVLTQCEPNIQRFKRVVSSKMADAHSRPYMVLLTLNGENICGAALVNRPPNHGVDLETGSSDILITAAHCVVEYRKKYEDGEGNIVYDGKHQFVGDPKSFKALFGKHNSGSYEDSQFEIGLANIIVHHRYNGGRSIWNDIAMVKLEQPVNFSSTVKPIALGRTDLSEVTNCSIAGWGRRVGIPAHLDPNSVLSVLDLNDVEIEGEYYKTTLDYSKETVVDGDSGSPMTCWHNNHLVLQGVTSHFDNPIEIMDSDMPNATYLVGKSAKFTSIKYFSDSHWIANAFKNIDKPSMWYNILKEQAYAVVPDAEQRFLHRTTQEFVKAFYMGLPFGFNFELNFPQWSDQEYFDLWFGEKIYNKISEAEEENVIDFFNVIGYTKQRDTYRCTIECFMRNRNRPCIYVYDLKRCYFTSKINLDSPMQVPLRALHIIMKETGTEAQLETVNAKTLWNISITVEDQKHYHCDGILVANGGKAYNKVNTSEKCLLELISTQDSPELSLTAIIDGTIHTSSLNFKRENNSVESGIVELEIQSFIPIPNVESGAFVDTGVLSEFPILRKYNPYSGAIRINPNARPFIARIVGRYTRKQCFGVLLDESSFMPMGEIPGDVTHYVLTTKACIERFGQHARYDFYNKAFTVKIGEYYIGTKSYYYQSSTIKSKHFSNDQLLNEFVLLELETPIKFNYLTKPAALMDAEISLQDKTIFSLSYDSACNFDWRKPLHEIPMELNMFSNVTDIMATRQLYVPNEHPCHSQDSHLGVPLFAYDSDKDVYHLLGLSSGFVNRENGFVDGYKSVQGYLPWIAGIINRSATQREISDQ